jgi:hypothetical protein
MTHLISTLGVLFHQITAAAAVQATLERLSDALAFLVVQASKTNKSAPVHVKQNVKKVTLDFCCFYNLNMSRSERSKAIPIVFTCLELARNNSENNIEGPIIIDSWIDNNVD